MSLHISIVPKIQPTTLPAPARPPLWMHQEDQQVFGSLRDCALGGGCPAVFTLLEPNLKVPLTRDWQYYIRAINPGMSPARVAAIFGYFRAFCNGTGLGDPDDPRANFLQNEDLLAPFPQFDKDRTCSRSVMTGTVDGSFLLAQTFDGNIRPPLKPGRTYPAKLADVDLDDYLYAPRTHPWLFFSANIVGERGQVVPFPNGAVYAWTGDGAPRTFLPHVSRHQVRYPLSRLRKLTEAEPVPSPYRSA